MPPFMASLFAEGIALVKEHMILGIVLALVISLVSQTFRAWSRLRHVPGPVSASLWKGWMLRHTLSGRMNLELKRVCDQYGSLVRVGPNELITCDPEILRRLWGVRTGYARGNFYDALRLNPERDNLLSMRSDAAHKVLKEKMAAGYAGKDLDNLEPKIDNQIASFINLIERDYISIGSDFRKFDLARKVQYFTLDVITDIGLGRPFGYTTTDSDVHHYIAMTEEALPIIMVFLLPSEKDKLGFGKFMGVAKEAVAERFGPNAKIERDMLGSFISHGLTQEEAESESLLQILAGSDTTATAIRSTMLYLMTNYLAYRELQKEIDRFIANGQISSPITDAEGRKLPYLQAVIKEGLRIHPPVTGLMFKTVPKGGDRIGEVFVPEGTDIGYCAWGVHHSKAIFGEDADLFRPERWLVADSDTLRTMQSTVDLVFNYGKWQCPGKSIAFIELNKIFVELLRRYDFTLANPTDPWKNYNAGVFIQSDLWVRVTRRGDS